MTNCAHRTGEDTMVPQGADRPQEPHSKGKSIIQTLAPLQLAGLQKQFGTLRVVITQLAIKQRCLPARVQKCACA
jgi:hypothetical protein